MNIHTLICELVNYAEECGLCSSEDREYHISMLMAKLRLSYYAPEAAKSGRALHEILSDICDYAAEHEIINENSVVFRDLFDTEIMGVLMDKPSAFNSAFRARYAVSPAEATEWFYNQCLNSGYIRRERIAKDMKWKADTEYGELDITVNLSKPEKDPKTIAMAKLLPQNDYPKCALCKENVGYAGDLNKPARETLRQIPLQLQGEEWLLQYSPYVYYNEHCILLCSEHRPMKTEGATFARMLEFTEKLPHYFIGSNADLPIVGGSILSHDHMQGGHYEFAMERAQMYTRVAFSGFEDLECGLVKWPMSVIRIRGERRSRLVELAEHILVSWQGYNDPDAFIFCKTDDTLHSTVTPIARRRGELYELDVVLRNNITTDEHPLGVFHPHEEHHNIKKENIGLIEVMGLAVLPARLKSELEILADAAVKGVSPKEIPAIEKHAEWFECFAGKYGFTEENALSILQKEVGATFTRVLEDAGVFKCTPEGKAAFMRFIRSAGGEEMK